MLSKAATTVAVLLAFLSVYTWAIWSWRDEVCATRSEQQVIAAMQLAADQARESIRRAAVEQQQVVEQGDDARATHEEVFQPIREVVRYVQVDAGGCAGEFDPRVRVALDEAVRAANSARLGRLQAAGDP